MQPEPEYKVWIEKSADDPPKYTVIWSATVNSGGWKLTQESVLVEDRLGKMEARIYAVVHEPQPDEVVTEAEETLTDRYDAGTTEVRLAELSMKHTVKDSKPTYAQLFGIVARYGDPYAK